MLKGKVGVVFGFASKKSIAWSIASSWQQAGAKVFIGLQSSRFQENLNNLTGAWPEKPQTFLCDVAKDEEIAAAFQFMKNEAPRVDMLAHSIAYATAHAMKSSFLETTREDYRVAHEISAYSLIALSAGVAPLMDPVEGGSIVSLSYLGSQRVVPSYKVMGTAKAALETTTKYLAAELGPRKIRVNCISAGPIDTLAARGIPGFRDMLTEAGQRAPMGRGVTGEDVGALATFLASKQAEAITGQTLYVDGGLSIY